MLRDTHWRFILKFTTLVFVRIKLCLTNMKSAIILILSILGIALAQRPWYAGTRPIGYPDLATRFKDEDNFAPTRAPNPNDYYNVPPNGIPIDAHGDIDLVNRLNSWPRPNRPFWILNADHIEAHRNTNRYAPKYHGYQGVHYRLVYN